MQTLKLTSNRSYLDNFQLNLVLTSSTVSGSLFESSSYNKLTDNVLVAEGDFNLVNNENYIVVVEEKVDLGEGAYSLSLHNLQGSAKEVSPNNFELE